MTTTTAKSLTTFVGVEISTLVATASGIYQLKSEQIV